MKRPYQLSHADDEERRIETERILREVESSPILTFGICGLQGSGKTLTAKRLFKTSFPVEEGRTGQHPVHSQHVTLNLGKSYKLDLMIIDLPGFSPKSPDKRLEQLQACLQDCDVLLWVLDASECHDSLEGFYLNEISQLGKPIVHGLNKIDLVPPCDWDTYYFIPSKQQEENIKAIVADKVESLSLQSRQIFPYSARYYMGLPTVFLAFIEAVGDDRKWRLGHLADVHSQQLITEYVYADMEI